VIRSYLVISAVISATADSSGGELSESETSLAQLRWALHNLSRFFASLRMTFETIYVERLRRPKSLFTL